MSETPVEKEEQKTGLDFRQLKLGIYGFLVMLFASLFFLKPYLPTALRHNFAGIYDYQFFSNRGVEAANPGTPWPVSTNTLAPPPPETEKLLSDLETTALLVIENGQIVYEKYSGSGGQDVLSGSFSMAKTVVGLLTGIAIQEKKIASLDEPIGTYLPEWSASPEGKITIKNLLTMSSGLNWDESYWNPFAVTAEAYYGLNLLTPTLKQRLIHDPGTVFSYQSGTPQLLGLILTRATNLNLAVYASKKLWIPMGAEKDALWSLDHENGMEKAYCCFNARARDFARIGQLMLQKGEWNHRPIVNPEYVTAMTTPNGVPGADGKPTDDYGYQTWIVQTPQGNVPYARGILGQAIIVIPQKNRVVVRLGSKTSESSDHHPAEVRALINWAMK